MIEIPRLRTDRLIMRGFEARDLDAYADMMADPEVTRFLGDGKPLGRTDAWRQLAMFAGHWVLNGFGLWAIEEASSGAFIGRIGCFQPEGWPGFEIGYTLARGAWGKGYAREGAGRALQYARQELNRLDIISLIRPDNLGSIGVATALGATPAESVEFFGATAMVYGYPRVAATRP